MMLPISSDTNDISVSGNNKRALRACIYCRRDKIKCDGDRPCSQCMKKGYANDACIDGCEACRKVRGTCVGGRPCKRCTEEKVECIAEPALPHGVAGALRTPRTHPMDRVKSACLNCRKDNKKCDEQIPCARCAARSEECIHINRKIIQTTKLRCEGCRDNHKKCSEERPCSNCVQEDRECVTLPRKTRGTGSRVKTACLDCRRDKIRCQGGRPCAHCIRRGLRCIEPSCKACDRAGTVSECTHKDNPTPGDGDAQAAQPATSIPPPIMIASPALLSVPLMPYYFPGALPAYPCSESQVGRQDIGFPVATMPTACYYPAIDPSLEAGSDFKQS